MPEISRGEQGVAYYGALADESERKAESRANLMRIGTFVLPVLMGLMLGAYASYNLHDTSPELLLGTHVAIATAVLVLLWARNSYYKHKWKALDHEFNMLRRGVEGDTPSGL